MPRTLFLSAALTVALPALYSFTYYQPLQLQRQNQTPTLRTGTHLVVVDVVVQDKSKKPVHGLKAEDFTLLENGAAQSPQSFEEHTAPTAEEIANAPAAPKLPPGIFTNYASAIGDGPLNILLLDRLNTPVGDQKEMQAQINKYLATARRGQRTAVFGLTDRLVLLQGFTDNPELLRQAVSKNQDYTSPLREQRMGGEGNSESLKPSDMVAMANSTDIESVAGVIAAMRQFEAVNTSAQTVLRGQFTFDAFNQLARYLAVLPGRKNLIWFSGSFPVDILPDLNKAEAQATNLALGRNTPPGMNDPFLGTATNQREFRETIGMLSRSRVSVYPIDARGIIGLDSESAANITTGTGLSGHGGSNPANVTLEQEMNTFTEKQTDEHTTMYVMAADTGGRAAVNTNGLTKAVEDAIADGANYYTIAYDPTNKDWHGDFRRIEVKLKAQGYSLNYRKGYYADDLRSPSAATNPLTATNGSASHAMVLAMMHGAPQPTQIVFTSRVLPVTVATEDAPAAGNRLSSGIKGPYRRYNVEFAIAPDQLKFSETPDGHRHATLEFVTAVYDKDGKMVNSIGKTIQSNIVAEAYSQFQQSGIPYQEEISVPAKGEYTLRVVVHQLDTDQVGAVELQVNSVSPLTPMQASK